MPENQTQGSTMNNVANPGGEPKLSPQPDRSFQEARPSDTEAAHMPDGGAVRDPRLQTEQDLDQMADQNHGSLDGHPSKDLSGDAQTGERLGERGNRLGQ